MAWLLVIPALVFAALAVAVAWVCLAAGRPRVSRPATRPAPPADDRPKGWAECHHCGNEVPAFLSGGTWRYSPHHASNRHYRWECVAAWCEVRTRVRQEASA